MKATKFLSLGRGALALTAFMAVAGQARAQSENEGGDSTPGINESISVEYVDDLNGRRSLGLNNANLWEGTFGLTYESRQDDKTVFRASAETDFNNRFVASVYVPVFKILRGGPEEFSSLRFAADAGFGGSYRNHPTIEGQAGILAGGRLLASVTVLDRLEIGGGAEVTATATVDQLFSADNPVTASGRVFGMLAYNLTRR